MRKDSERKLKNIKITVKDIDYICYTGVINYQIKKIGLQY